jgi:DNA-binding XRE family transcriptional regulator
VTEHRRVAPFDPDATRMTKQERASYHNEDCGYMRAYACTCGGVDRFLAAERRSLATRTLGQVVRQAREAKGLTLRQLAKEIGVSASFLVDVEKDRRKPLRERLPKFAEVLGVTVEDLRIADPRTTEERLDALERRVARLEKGPWRG